VLQRRSRRARSTLATSTGAPSFRILYNSAVPLARNSQNRVPLSIASLPQVSLRTSNEVQWVQHRPFVNQTGEMGKVLNLGSVSKRFTAAMISVSLRYLICGV
jgi:hypothetical protein